MAQSSTITITSDYTVITSDYWATSQNAYNVNASNSIITIGSGNYVAAGGGNGGYNQEGGSGGNAIYNITSSDVTFYNYGYLLGGGGGAGGNNGSTGGVGGAGGGGAGGGDSGGGGPYTGGNGGGIIISGNYVSDAGGGGGYYNKNGYNGVSNDPGMGGIGGGGGGAANPPGYDGTTLSGGRGGNGAGGGAGGGNGGPGQTSGGIIYSGGGGGSGGGLGGNGSSSENYDYGGNGGFGINSSYSYTLTNAQGIYPYDGGNTYYGPLYVTGCLPSIYSIYITDISCYGQLFLGPVSYVAIANTIGDFYISQSCYSNIATIFENSPVGTLFKFLNVFYNNSNIYGGTAGNIFLGNYPSSSLNSYTFSYNGVNYSYYLDNSSTLYSSSGGINLYITKVSTTLYTTYSNNSITCSDLSNNTMYLNGSLRINPSYSNTITGMQFGFITDVPVNTLTTIYFNYAFASSNIFISCTSQNNGFNTSTTYSVTNIRTDSFEIYINSSNGTNFYYMAICYSL